MHTVLIVEDDRELRRLFRMALVFEGFTVQEAGNGLDALRLLDADPPDLVLLDLGLPFVSGYVVRQEIAAHAHTRHIPIVVVTAAPVEADQLEVACVLRKPVLPEHLVQTVKRCMRSGAPGIGS